MYKYLSILLLIFITAKASFSIAEEQKIYIPITSERPYATLKTKGDLLDVSDIIERIRELPQKYPYEENLEKLQKIKQNLQQDIANLCKNSPECIEDATTRILEASQQTYQEMEEMTLFPKGYYPVDAPIGYQEMQEALDCNHCSKNTFRNRIWYGSDQVHSEVFNKIKNKDVNCIAQILNRIVNKIETQRIPQECLNKESRNNFVCQTIDEDIRIRQNRIENLTALFVSPQDTFNIEGGICLTQNFTTNTGISDIKDFLNKVQELEICQSLEPGSEKKIFPYGYLVTPFHSVQRKLNGSYVINLNMHFVAGKNYDGSIPQDQIPEHYMTKVKKCMNKANPKLIGPNGEKLNIIISSPKDTCEKKKSEKIEIQSRHHRSNTFQYSSNIDCPSILHEMLHLFGLEDEYEERSYSQKENLKAISDNYGQYSHSVYDCRFTSEDSIMSNHWKRWNSTFNKEKNISLLSPRHFNFILYGKCQEKNQFFYECIEQAGQHSIDHPSCLEKKEQCEDRYS